MLVSWFLIFNIWFNCASHRKGLDLSQFFSMKTRHKLNMLASYFDKFSACSASLSTLDETSQVNLEYKTNEIKVWDDDNLQQRETRSYFYKWTFKFGFTSTTSQSWFNFKTPPNFLMQSGKRAKFLFTGLFHKTENNVWI